MDLDDEAPIGGGRVRVSGRQPAAGSLRGGGAGNGTPPGVSFPSALRRRRASFDGDSFMTATTVDMGLLPRRGQATPPSRAQSSAGDSELGDDEDETMSEVRPVSNLRLDGRPRMRCKRKRDCALTGVCDKLGSMQLSDEGTIRGRSTDSLGARTRSKSILKKTHSGSRVRFARHGRAMKDYVMFDEGNIKEVQTCLASLSDSSPVVAPTPATPRAVVLFQQAEESGGESGAVPRTAAPAATIATAAGAAAAAAILSAGGLIHQAQAEAARAAPNYFSEPSGGEQSQPAKRGPNWARKRRSMARQQEVEEGKSFKHILRQVITEEEDVGRGVSPPARTGSMDLGRPTSPTSDVSGGFGVGGSPLQCASPPQLQPGAAFGTFQPTGGTPPVPGGVGFKFAAPPDQGGAMSSLQPAGFPYPVGPMGPMAPGPTYGATGFKFTDPSAPQNFVFGSGLSPFTNFGEDG